MTRADLYKIRSSWLQSNWLYERSYYKDFDFSILDNVMYIKRAGKGKNNDTYNDAIIMADTETSKEKKGEICKNYIVAWTISIRAFNQNICTLYGHKPSELIDCINQITAHMQGNKTIIYWHNIQYDWVFIRKFCFRAWGVPKEQLNIKPHYPLFINFDNGIIFKDSLILAQRSIEKWAEDLQVEHRKAVGRWNYEKIRCQNNYIFTEDELDYIECDTVAGVECLQATMDVLHKHIYSMPYTATGIPREDVRKLSRDNRGRDWFKKVVPAYYIHLMLEAFFHGGYTHGNRHYINQVIDWIKTVCRDLSSSYPFQMMSKKFPMGRFKPLSGAKSIDWILKHGEKYAFLFKLILVDYKVKDDFVAMPLLQVSKCIKLINPVTDNGRLLAASYAELYLNEVDLKLIYEQMSDKTKAAITDLHYCHKDYLPRWFTDYIYKCYEDKCNLKGKDPVLYALAKSKVNSLYGMSCQHPVKPIINEDYDTGLFAEEKHEDPNYNEEMYNKYAKKYTSVLPYQIGCWVTSYALADLFALGACCGYWWYSDTDSCYGSNWDESKVDAFNKRQRDLLKANGYDPVIANGVEYCPGVAEIDGEYKSFRFLGAKRYSCITYEDKLKITVAGVPKKAGAKLLKNIDNFHKGYVFNFSDPEKLLDDTDKRKLQHTYFFEDDIYIDENGNERGDSIDLSPTTYVLDDCYNPAWDTLFEEELSVQCFDYEEE